MKLIQKLSKLALITSVAVLGTACGSDDEVASDAATAFRQSIVGTWSTACRDESAGGNSHQGSVGTFVITMDGVTNSGVEFAETTCDTQSGTWGPDDVTFTIGDVFTTGGGTAANELDIGFGGETFYSSIQLVADQILIADEVDGGTVGNRDVTFTSPEIYTKQ